MFFLRLPLELYCAFNKCILSNHYYQLLQVIKYHVKAVKRKKKNRWGEVGVLRSFVADLNWSHLTFFPNAKSLAVK